MHLHVVRSGSSGNLAVLGNGSHYEPDYALDSEVLLIDCGITKAMKWVEENNLIGRVAGVVYTHYHSDHFNPAAVKAFNRADIPQFVPFGLSENLKTACSMDVIFTDSRHPSEMFENCQVMSDYIEDVETFHCLHDVPCFGYAFTLTNGEMFTWIPDTAQITNEMLGYIAASTYVGIDMDYDQEMTETRCYPDCFAEMAGRLSPDAQPYTEELIARIISRGHLSNQKVIQTMAANPQVRHWWVNHLSNAFNHPEVVKGRMKEAGLNVNYTIGHKNAEWKPTDVSFGA